MSCDNLRPSRRILPERLRNIKMANPELGTRKPTDLIIGAASAIQTVKAADGMRSGHDLRLAQFRSGRQRSSEDSNQELALQPPSHAAAGFATILSKSEEVHQAALFNREEQHCEDFFKQTYPGTRWTLHSTAISTTGSSGAAEGA